MRKLIFVCLFLTHGYWSQPLPLELKIDSNYAYLQAYTAGSLQKFQSLFNQVDSNKLVILHYGGSHIQAENPTTVARKKLQTKFGDGGRGLMFNYGAANTYSSINYASTFTGHWDYNKSFQGRKANLPLGVCGMVVETFDSTASLSFNLKSSIQKSKMIFTVLFENDSLSNHCSIWVNNWEVTQPINWTSEGCFFTWEDTIKNIELKIKNAQGKRFRFYGINIEKEDDSGVVYHSTGVGAAAFRSILILEKLPEHTRILNPDIVLLDFGTNDILYHNSIDPHLPSEIENAISWWRKMVPEVLVVLTSTQDLYKKKQITAGVEFRNLMDSLARKNDCLFWNWYDLSGGLNTIRTWNELGYAQKDNIHLTKKGYEVKGGLLYLSFINTLLATQKNPGINEVTVTLKSYSDTITASNSQVDPPVRPKKYTVKSGDSLSKIAEKHHTTVAKIKKLNGLRTDLIRTGQVLKIPLTLNK